MRKVTRCVDKVNAHPQGEPMMKITLSIVSLATLTSACNVHTTRVERESRWALAEYNANSSQHLTTNWYDQAEHVMTCPFQSPKGLVGIPARGFEDECSMPMTSH